MRYTLDRLKNAYDMLHSSSSFVYFWGHEEKDGEVTKACFSQWYPCHFVIDGIRYNCAEQYMMAEKARIFHDEITRKKILQATDPSVIKKLGREVQNFDAAIWDVESYNVVVRGNVAKFSQNEDLRKVLTATGMSVLVEASPYDTIWGIGMNQADAEKVLPYRWKGSNKLGFALMKVRDEVKQIKK